MTETLWAVVTGGAIGVVGAVVGGAFTYRGLVRVQKETDKRERRGQAVTALGDLRALIDNMSPDMWAMWGSSEVELFRTYADQWSEIRPRFIGLQALYPDHRDDIEKAYTTMNNLRVEVSLLMERVRNHQDLDNLRDQALKTHQEARDLVGRLMDVVAR